jgi:uncharacterized protein YxeA
MKKILTIVLLATTMNVFATTIHNSDGSTSYVHNDSGNVVISNSDGSSTYVSKDPSGAARIDNSDGSTSYITNGFE